MWLSLSDLPLQRVFAMVQDGATRAAVVAVCRHWHTRGKRWAWPAKAYLRATLYDDKRTLAELWAHSRDWIIVDQPSALVFFEVVLRFNDERARSLADAIIVQCYDKRVLLHEAVRYDAAWFVQRLLPHMHIRSNEPVEWLTRASRFRSRKTVHTLLADVRVLDPRNVQNSLVYCAALHGREELIAPLLGDRTPHLSDTLEANEQITLLFENTTLLQHGSHAPALLWAAAHGATNVIVTVLPWLRAAECHNYLRLALQSAREHSHVDAANALAAAAAANDDAADDERRLALTDRSAASTE